MNFLANTSSEFSLFNLRCFLPKIVKFRVVIIRNDISYIYFSEQSKDIKSYEVLTLHY